MNKTEAMGQWLEGFLDFYDGGVVQIGHKDDIPGNCCLTYLGSHVLSRMPALDGSSFVRSRSRFYLTRVARGGDGFGWIHNLEDWAEQSNCWKRSPGWGSDVRVWVANARRIEKRTDDTEEYGMDIYVEATEYWEGVL